MFVGTIKRSELEEVLTKAVLDLNPIEVIRGFTYNQSGVVIETDLHQIEIQIDWTELILEDE